MSAFHECNRDVHGEPTRRVRSCVCFSIDKPLIRRRRRFFVFNTRRCVRSQSSASCKQQSFVSQPRIRSVTSSGRFVRALCTNSKSCSYDRNGFHRVTVLSPPPRVYRGFRERPSKRGSHTCQRGDRSFSLNE